MTMDKQTIQRALKAGLSIGHLVSGKSKDEFVKDVRPFLSTVAQLAEGVSIQDYLELMFSV